jgi:acetyl esterase/lipase
MFSIFAGMFSTLGPNIGSAQRPRGLRLPVSIERIADIPYAGNDNSRQTLDLLLPKERDDEPLPVVVFIHGGAWMGGHKQNGLPRIAPYVASGEYAGVTVGYRLSGEAQWPSQIHDCKAAIRWVRANAEMYNLDADRIGVWGASAGGHLVAMLGTSGDVPEMDGELGPHTGVSSRVQCVVDFFGPTDFTQINAQMPTDSRLDHDAPDSPESRLIGGPVLENPDKVATANPITYVTADDPPMLLVHGTRDPLVPHHQSQLLDEALAGVDVDSTLVTVDGGGHGAGFGGDVDDAVRRFLAHHLRGVEADWEDATVKAAGR